MSHVLGFAVVLAVESEQAAGRLDSGCHGSFA